MRKTPQTKIEGFFIFYIKGYPIDLFNEKVKDESPDQIRRDLLLIRNIATFVLPNPNSKFYEMSINRAIPNGMIIPTLN
jgi:hypothetical protein